MSRFIRYSELFSAPQGEGATIGIPSLWVRLWGCNLTCQGFFQKDPTDPSTYVLPYDNLDFSKITKLEDLPVLDKGCDSAYSWNKDFMRLAKKASPHEIAQQLYAMTDGIHNSSTGFDVVFTGGEPMMNQSAIIDILTALDDLDRYRLSRNVTIETNGTRDIKPEFSNYLESDYFFKFSISPKLFTVTGEKDVVNPEIINEYHELLATQNTFSDTGDRIWLKFVVANRPECWNELDEALAKIDDVVVDNIPVYIMPVGATEEQQSSADVAAICDEVNKRGLRFSPRVQNYVYGNAVSK